MAYELCDLDDRRLREVRSAWSDEAGADAFATEMEHAFDWAETHLVPKAGSSQAFELCMRDDGNAVALVEIIDSKQLSLTKILRLYSAPSFWSPVTEHEKYEVAELYTGALSAILARGVESSNMATIKIYGRTDVALSIFRSVVNIWSHANDGWTAKLEGRWLTIDRQHQGRRP